MYFLTVAFIIYTCMYTPSCRVNSYYTHKLLNYIIIKYYMVYEYTYDICFGNFL